MIRKIDVLKLAPGEQPCKAELALSEYHLCKAVNVGTNYQCKAKGRRIEDDICVIFNNARSRAGLTPNRYIADDILCGVVYIAGIDSVGRLTSLADDEMQRYAYEYRNPENYSLDEALSANLTYAYNVQVQGKDSRDIKLIYN